MYDVPAGYTEQLLACEWLCHINPSLRRLGADSLREALRRWFDHGWTPRDICYALDHYPTGEQQYGESPAFNADPKVTASYVRRRLASWLDEEDNPLPPINQHITRNRDERLRRQQQTRADWQRIQREAVRAADSPHARLAKMIAADAAAKARRTRAHHEHQEQLHQAEEIAERRRSAQRWQGLVE